MGVLDLRSIRKLGLEQQLGTELWTSFLLSQVLLIRPTDQLTDQLTDRPIDRPMSRCMQIARRGCCPHFLRLYQCFLSASAPPSEPWGEIELSSEAEEVDHGESSASEEDADAEAALETVAVEAAAVEAAAVEAAKPRRARKPAAVTRKPAGNAACYQYVMMQFAEFGDMEEAW